MTDNRDTLDKEYYWESKEHFLIGFLLRLVKFTILAILFMDLWQMPAVKAFILDWTQKLVGADMMADQGEK